MGNVQGMKRGPYKVLKEIDPNMPILTKRIAELMEENNCTNERLCERIDISMGTISNILNKGTQPKANVLKQIANEFNVSVDYLVGNTNERNPNISIQAMNQKLGLTIEALQALQDFHKKHSCKPVVDAECEFLEELITNQSIFTACELAIKHANTDYFDTIDKKIKEEKKLLESDSENIGLHYVELRKLNAEKERRIELKEFEKWKIMKTIEQGIDDAMDSLNLVYDKINKESEENKMNVYETNKTMKMLGKQDIFSMLNYERYRQLEDVLNAHCEEAVKKHLQFVPLKDFEYSVYMLGYICGKHDERQRRK